MERTPAPNAWPCENRWPSAIVAGDTGKRAAHACRTTSDVLPLPVTIALDNPEETPDDLVYNHMFILF
jgi:hypothetical protein